jgi:DNA-binding MarR family transcriptional regulator
MTSIFSIVSNNPIQTLITDSCDKEFLKMGDKGIDAREIRILIQLMTRGPSDADDISRRVGLKRSETYTLLSSLLCRGVVFSAGEMPQKYYVLGRREATDLML